MFFLLPNFVVSTLALNYSMLYKAFDENPTLCQLRASWIFLICLPHLSRVLDQRCREDILAHRTLLYVVTLLLAHHFYHCYHHVSMNAVL